MDDCNSRGLLFLFPAFLVQIPLWTIVTSQGCLFGSKGVVQIPLWTIVTVQTVGDPAKSYERSDSSMDDCNSQTKPITEYVTYVQIPLWTIVTRIYLQDMTDLECSDSSMDDCNISSQYLITRIMSSDSSMDDCNGRSGVSAWGAAIPVQIPLWTIVTGRVRTIDTETSLFRFLYGRL